MTSTPPGVELLARAVAYTCSALALVSADDLARPTPCAGWCLTDLLAHLDDALDAFTEAAGGQVWLAPTTPALLLRPVTTAADLQAKTGGLLEAWSRPATVVHVGGTAVPASIVATTAALEVAVHGNDVARTVRHPLVAGLRQLPGPLARGLVAAAAELAPADDRAGRFDPPRAVPADADDSARLLAHLGRAPQSVRGARQPD